MKTKLVNRYTCDFCKKASCSAPHMSKHEKACTNNPNRICGMCKILGEKQPTIGDLIAAAKTDEEIASGGDSLFGQPHKLREAANSCPACMLAGMRQSGACLEFCYSEEVKSFWEDVNGERAESEMHG